MAISWRVGNTQQGFNELYPVVLTIHMLIFYLIFFISSTLYIPIFLSIRKHAHLVSIVKNRPHKYILFQTVFTITAKFKTDRFIRIDSTGIKSIHFNEKIYFLITRMDAVCTVVLIQASYLLCNKKNLEATKTLLKGALRKLCCGFCKENAVQPMEATNFQNSVYAVNTTSV